MGALPPPRHDLLPLPAELLPDPQPLPPAMEAQGHTSSPMTVQEWSLPCPPLAQPGKTPWGVESGRGDVRGWGGRRRVHGHLVLYPGPDTGDANLGAHPLSQIMLSSLGGGVTDAEQGWRHVGPFLAALEVWGWTERPVPPSPAFELCPRPCILPHRAVEPLPRPGAHEHEVMTP